MAEFKRAVPTRLDPDKTFVFGLSTAIAMDDPNLTVQWSRPVLS